MTSITTHMLLLFGAWAVGAGEPTPSAADNASGERQPPSSVNSSNVVATSTLAPTNSPLRMLGPGIFEIGKVRLDQRRRRVTFSAMLNRAEGPMEYFLVTTYGKTHESILKTAAAPVDIHVAMLLLGARSPGNGDFPGSPQNGVPGPVVHPSGESIPGDKASIEVAWKTPHGETRYAAEDLIYNQNTRGALKSGAWVYNGSLLIHGKFLAQEDGSIISLVTDPVALVNNISPGHDNDQIWTANTNNAPPTGVPVEVSITLEQPKPK